MSYLSAQKFKTWAMEEAHEQSNMVQYSLDLHHLSSGKKVSTCSFKVEHQNSTQKTYKTWMVLHKLYTNITSQCALRANASFMFSLRGYHIFHSFWMTIFAGTDISEKLHFSRKWNPVQYYKYEENPLIWLDCIWCRCWLFTCTFLYLDLPPDVNFWTLNMLPSQQYQSVLSGTASYYITALLNIVQCYYPGPALSW